MQIRSESVSPVMSPFLFAACPSCSSINFCSRSWIVKIVLHFTFWVLIVVTLIVLVYALSVFCVLVVVCLSFVFTGYLLAYLNSILMLFKWVSLYCIRFKIDINNSLKLYSVILMFGRWNNNCLYADYYEEIVYMNCLIEMWIHKF